MTEVPRGHLKQTRLKGRRTPIRRPKYAVTFRRVTFNRSSSMADLNPEYTIMIKPEHGISRRTMLSTASLTVGALVAGSMAQAADHGRTDPGPGNSALDTQNPNSAWPPATDSKSLVPTFKY